MKNTPLIDAVMDSAPGLLAALFYGVVSGSMSFINKIVMTTHSYHFPDVVMLTQIIYTAIIIEICRMSNLCEIPPWSITRSKEFAVPSFCFALHTTLALAALDDLSIPIYNVLRRMLPLASLIMGTILLKKYPSRGVTLSVMIIVAGTLFAGFGDLHFHLAGYSDAILSVLAQSVYLTYVQKTGVEKSISALSVLHINSINCIPILLLLTLANGHLSEGLQFPGFQDPSFLVYFLVNVNMGCLLNYSLFLCATKNSALTTSFVGVIKGVITTIIGFFTFGGVPATLLTVGGVALNAFGGAVYSFVRYKEKRAEISNMLEQKQLHTYSPSKTNNLNGFFPRHRHDSSSIDDVDSNSQTVVSLGR